MSAKSARLSRRRSRKESGNRKTPALTWSDTLTLAGSLALAAVLALAASDARACDLAMSQSPSTVVINYNPFAIGPSSGAIDLGLKNQGDEACELRLSFVDDGGAAVSSLALGGVGVQFRPREASGLQTSDVEPGVFRYTLAGKATGQAQLDAAIVVDAVPDAGTYASDLKLLVKDADGTALLAPIPVRMQLVSTPRAQLNLAGAAGAFGSGSSVEVVDFGDASTGLTRRIFVQVRANAPSVISIKSEHGGVMRRQGDVETESNVAYAVELDGAAVDLTAPWTKDVDPPRTLAGMSLPMLFTLGEVKDQMAGRYQDVIAIDISPH